MLFIFYASDITIVSVAKKLIKMLPLISRSLLFCYYSFIKQSCKINTVGKVILTLDMRELRFRDIKFHNSANKTWFF